MWSLDSGGEVSGAPAIADERVLCPSDAGCLLALSLESGEELWRADLTPPIRCSPAVTEDAAIVGDESGRIFCCGH